MVVWEGAAGALCFVPHFYHFVLVEVLFKGLMLPYPLTL